MAPAIRKSYTIFEKLQILEKRKESVLSGRKFAESVGINEATLRVWLGQEEKLMKYSELPMARRARNIPRKKKKRVKKEKQIPEESRTQSRAENDNNSRSKALTANEIENLRDMENLKRKEVEDRQQKCRLCLSTVNQVENQVVINQQVLQNIFELIQFEVKEILKKMKNS